MISQLYLYQACITAYHRVPAFVGLNVIFVKHGCSWYSDSNYSMSDVNSSKESEREGEREKFMPSDG